MNMVFIYYLQQPVDSQTDLADYSIVAERYVAYHIIQYNELYAFSSSSSESSRHHIRPGRINEHWIRHLRSDKVLCLSAD